MISATKTAITIIVLILLGVAGGVVYTVADTRDGQDSSAENATSTVKEISDPLTDKEALTKLYGDTYKGNRDPSFVEWAPTDNPEEIWENKDQYPLATEVIASTTVRTKDGTPRQMIMTSTKPKSWVGRVFGHVSAPKLGSAVFTKRGGRWDVTSKQPAITEMGSGGSLNEPEEISLGPTERHTGFQFKSGFSNMGVTKGNITIYALVDDRVQKVLEIEDAFESNSGATNSDSDTYSYDTTLRTASSSGSTFNNIIATTKGTKGEVVSFKDGKWDVSPVNKKVRYTFKGGRYRSVTDGDQRARSSAGQSAGDTSTPSLKAAERAVEFLMRTNRYSFSEKNRKNRYLLHYWDGKAIIVVPSTTSNNWDIYLRDKQGHINTVYTGLMSGMDLPSIQADTAFMPVVSHGFSDVCIQRSEHIAVNLRDNPQSYLRVKHTNDCEQSISDVLIEDSQRSFTIEPVFAGASCTEQFVSGKTVSITGMRASSENKTFTHTFRSPVRMVCEKGGGNYAQELSIKDVTAGPDTVGFNIRVTDRGSLKDIVPIGFSFDTGFYRR